MKSKLIIAFAILIISSASYAQGSYLDVNLFGVLSGAGTTNINNSGTSLRPINGGLKIVEGVGIGYELAANNDISAAVEVNYIRMPLSAFTNDAYIGQDNVLYGFSFGINPSSALSFSLGIGGASIKQQMYINGVGYRSGDLDMYTKVAAKYNLNKSLSLLAQYLWTPGNTYDATVASAQRFSLAGIGLRYNF